MVDHHLAAILTKLGVASRAEAAAVAAREGIALKGFWSIRITGNWRVIFRFGDGDAFDVDLVDYH